jgi:peptide/nickel transport system substrate-binding protein
MRRLALAVLVLCACPKQEAPDAGASAAVTPALKPSLEWLKGKLPDSALWGAPLKGGTLTVRVAVEPNGLNRLHDAMAEGTMSRYTVGTVYETLAELDRDTHPRYDLKPLLAQTWEESPDHKTLTVHLRKGVHFHDGTPFTSRDVKAVLDAVLNPKHATKAIASYFDDVESLATPDEHTVVVKWKKTWFLGNRNFLTALPMMPAKALEGDFDTLAINRAPIGTGPWKFVSWESNQALTFARFEGYWGAPVWLDKIVVRFVKDETVAAQLWEKGEFDLMTRIPPAVWRSIEKPEPANAWAIRGYHRVMASENNYGWIGWNEQRPFFADRRVRQALGHLFPYEKVARNIDLDLERPTTCPYFAEGPSCDPTVKPLTYDPKLAAQLLDEAGWKDTNGDGVRDKDGLPFKFTFVSNAYSVKLGRLLPLLQDELRRAGIEMDIEKVEAGGYLKRLRDQDFDACSLTWSNADPVQDNFPIFHSSLAGKSGSNFVGYQNLKVDQLLEQIRDEFDDRRRIELERNVHRLLYEDQVYLFLTNRPTLDAVKVGVQGMKPSIAWYDLRRVWRVPVLPGGGGPLLGEPHSPQAPPVPPP